MQDRLICRRTLGIVAGAVAFAGVHACATAHVYDAYYSDYHVWNAQEVAYYQQWEAETHRPDRRLAERPPDEEKAYWEWRHDHATRPVVQPRPDSVHDG
jgi:hypothetical protein